MLAFATSTVCFTVLARGRGLSKLIEGLSEGDPVAWGIVGVVVVFFGVSYFVKKKKSEASDSNESDQ